MDNEYRYTPETWDQLARRRMDWRDVDWLLRHEHPVIRERIGPTLLRIIGQGYRRRWLMVTLEELHEDDVYVIRDARFLDDIEAGVARMMTGEQP